MRISKVTMTGADDSTPVEQLVELSSLYPFVEWGILLSRNSQGHPRFPSSRWRNELNVAADTSGIPMKLSGHLCGAYVRELLMDNLQFIAELGPLWEAFDRMQINTHGIEHSWVGSAFVSMEHISGGTEWIFQYDNANKLLLEYVQMAGRPANISTLFDLSHGAGVLPSQWPKPIPGIKCGYAGGLSPANIRAQLEKLNNVVGDAEVWIDMETHVRSNNGRLFDLAKVQEVLESCIQSELVELAV